MEGCLTSPTAKLIPTGNVDKVEVARNTNERKPYIAVLVTQAWRCSHILIFDRYACFFIIVVRLLSYFRRKYRICRHNFADLN